MAVIDAIAVVNHARATVSRWLQQPGHAPALLPDAELVESNDHRVLSWRSRSQTSCSALAHLADAPGGCTEVRLVLSGPAVTEAARPLIAREISALDHALDEEVGRVLARREPGDAVQAASEESFPASDAPSWTPTKGPTPT